MANSATSADWARSDFKAYDRLPHSVKIMLQNAAWNIDTVEIYARSYRCDPDECIDEISDKIRRLTAKRVRDTYGPDHPQAQA